MMIVIDIKEIIEFFLLQFLVIRSQIFVKLPFLPPSFQYILPIIQIKKQNY